MTRGINQSTGHGNQYRHGEIQWIDGRRVASPEYRAWTNMRNRCFNRHGRDWRYYGGRGITIDPTWNEFERFLADMGRRPTPLHTLERKDGNKGYFKGNCEWATRQRQARNRAYVKLSEHKAALIRAAYIPGQIRQVDLARRFGVSQRTICLVVRGEGWRI